MSTATPETLAQKMHSMACIRTACKIGGQVLAIKRYDNKDIDNLTPMTENYGWYVAAIDENERGTRLYFAPLPSSEPEQEPETESTQETGYTLPPEYTRYFEVLKRLSNHPKKWVGVAELDLSDLKLKQPNGSLSRLYNTYDCLERRKKSSGRGHEYRLKETYRRGFSQYDDLNKEASR